MQDHPNHRQPLQPIQAPPSLLAQVLRRIQQAEQVAEDSTLFSLAFTSSDWTWRVAAIEQLAHAEREVALSWLERALSDAHPSVRARAVSILSQHQASELIQPALHDLAWQVREVAMLALGIREEPTSPAFPTLAQSDLEISHQPSLHTTRLKGKSHMRPIDQPSTHPFSFHSGANVLQNPAGISPIQHRVRNSLQSKRRPRLLTFVAALLVSLVLMSAMLLIFAPMRSQTPNTSVGSSASTTAWNACKDDSNKAEAALCAAHKETILNITKTYGTQKVTFLRAYADRTQLLLVYTDGLASTDAVGFESVTIQHGMVLNSSGNNGYSNPITHQGYNVASFATKAVPTGTTELHIQSIVDGLSGKPTSLNIVVPFHTDQKTVQVNQTATSKGISLSLKRLVFTGSKTVFYVGPLPYANGGYVSISVASMMVNGKPLVYAGGQSGDNIDGVALITISLDADLYKPGSWTIQIHGDQERFSETWTWTYHFTVPDTTQTK
ncbi:MAG TPA: HEAT repeat domain-containing protein [Ktedonobacteraceae bacterium]|nr:HEAT repeat domain-containing protein [Ktedonobacteraceae bacterium]